MRKGFTIVELLVVVAIIGILLGIVGTAASSTAKAARLHRATSMKKTLENAISAFYSQNGRWPVKIEDAANGNSNANDFSVEIVGRDADSVFQEIVIDSIGKNATKPLLDVSALFVAKAGDIKNNNGCYDNHEDRNKSNYCGNQNCAYGMNFPDAINKGIDVKDMAFGWQRQKTGRFCRFKIRYNAKADSVEVVL